MKAQWAQKINDNDITVDESKQVLNMPSAEQANTQSTSAIPVINDLQ